MIFQPKRTRPKHAKIWRKPTQSNFLSCDYQNRSWGRVERECQLIQITAFQGLVKKKLRGRGHSTGGFLGWAPPVVINKPTKKIFQMDDENLQLFFSPEEKWNELSVLPLFHFLLLCLVNVDTAWPWTPGSSLKNWDSTGFNLVKLRKEQAHWGIH